MTVIIGFLISPDADISIQIKRMNQINSLFIIHIIGCLILHSSQLIAPTGHESTASWQSQVLQASEFFTYAFPSSPKAKTSGHRDTQVSQPSQRSLSMINLFAMFASLLKLKLRHHDLWQTQA